MHAETRNRAEDLQIFSLTLSHPEQYGARATWAFYERGIVPWLPRAGKQTVVTWEASTRHYSM